MKAFLPLLVALLVFMSRSQSDEGAFDQQEIISDPTPKILEQNVANDSKPSTLEKPARRQFKFDIETLKLYKYEVLAIFGIFAYLIFYRRGKAQNYELMEKFYKKTKHFYSNNFSHIGFTKNHQQDPFVAQSASQAMFYATGRNNVNYLEIKFNMLKRQDLLYHLIYETMYPEKDTITIDISVESNQPIVLCLVNKKKLKSITENNLDLSKLAGTFDVKGLNNYYHCLGQSGEVIDSVIDSNTVRKLNQLSTLVHSIHYTDQKVFSESEGHLRAVFYASQKNVEKYLNGIEVLFSLVDKIKDLKISSTYKGKAMKAREVFNASIEKQKLEKHKQQLRKKKEEKRKQQEAWLRSLPPEKQKREDEKRKKKQINKLLKSRVMKVG